MIDFACQNCGSRMHAQPDRAGLSGTCPNCKSVVFIPPQQSQSELVVEESDQQKFKSLFSESDELLLDIQPKQKEVPAADAEHEPSQVHPAVDAEIRQEAKELKRKLGLEHAELPQFRKYPWFIDILLYPMNAPGLIMVGILALGSLLIDIITFIPILGLVLGFLGALIKLIFALYMYWYFCECVRDSAEGGLRAPETIAITPSMGPLFRQWIYLIIYVVIPAMPAFYYFNFMHRTDLAFWALCACGLFFLPISLLSGIMFDSLRAFNPFRWFKAVFTGFFAYCGVVLAFCAVAWIAYRIFYDVYSRDRPSLPPFILIAIEVYIGMIAAHLLGRFYWRYKDKLYWEV